jgi:hypothetical protein
MTNARIKARDGRGRAIRALETIEQDQKAAELRSASLTYPQIGEVLGIEASTAHRSADRGFKAAQGSEDVVAAKAAELLKLDRRERRLWTEYGKELLTPEQLATLNSAFDRVAKRRADLLGLDEPTRSRVENITEDVFASAIERLNLEMAAQMAALEVLDRDDTSDHSESGDGVSVPGHSSTSQ